MTGRATRRSFLRHLAATAALISGAGSGTYSLTAQGVASGGPGPGAEPKPGPAVADFVDIAARAGLTARTVIGGTRTKDFILETTGGGVALLDYDNDGWLDV